MNVILFTWAILRALTGAGGHTQVCRNCQPDSACQTSLTSTPKSETVDLSADCYATCQMDPDCEMTHYDPPARSCTYHECRGFTQAPYSQYVFRSTENPDCLEFEIFIMDGFRSSCGANIGPLEDADDASECISTCADMNSCSSITFDKSEEHCYYYNCLSMEESPGHVYVKKKCLDLECSKDYVQTCLNCHIGENCQGYIHVFITPTIEDGVASLLASSNGNTAVYNYTHGYGLISECTKIRQQPYSTLVASRRTCSQECPTFRLFTVDDEEGLCTELETDQGGVSEEYCVERCLDMDNCLSVSYNVEESWCKYHACLESQPNVSFRHIRRECVDTTAAKNYTQTCWNCDSLCHSPIDSHTPVTSPEMCSISCPYCESAKFDPTTDSCVYYQCDESLVPDVGSVVMRQTSNPDCLDYELFGHSGWVPTCDPIGQTTGVRNVMYCVKACLDMPGCRGTSFQSKICTYYNCSTLVETSGNLFIEKTCIEACNTTTLQTCFNCGMGLECPSAIASGVADLSMCVTACSNNQKCHSAHTTPTGVCGIYACQEVTQEYQSVIYRKSCDPECPLYEIYEWSGQMGTCSTLWTQYFIAKPYLCLTRCLDMTGCHGVTYKPYTCTYHSCDCSETTDDAGSTFLWRFCLSSQADLTILPGGNASTPTDYPKATYCGTTTATSTIASTSTSTSVSSAPSTSTPLTTGSMASSTETTVSSTSTFVSSATSTSTPLTTGSTASISETTVSSTSTFVSSATSTLTPLTTGSTASSTETTVSSTSTFVSSATSTSTPLTIGSTASSTETTVSSTSTYVSSATSTSTESTTGSTASSTETTVSSASTFVSPATSTSTPVTPGSIESSTETTVSSTSTSDSPATSTSTQLTPGSTTNIVATAEIYVAVPIYLLPCFCSTGTFTNKTNAEIIAEIRATLYVNPKNTSSARRRLTCAEDDRMSSQMIGFAGSVCLVVVTILCTGTDIVSVIKAMVLFGRANAK